MLLGFASSSSIKGCWEKGIREIEKDFGYKLPDMYRQFLLKMGCGAGKFFQGTDIFWKKGFLDYKDWREFRDAFLYTIDEDNFDFKLADNCFVFAHHQGYIHWFFYVTEGEDDPTVYGYKSGDLLTKKVSDSFSQFLTDSLEEQKENIHLI